MNVRTYVEYDPSRCCDACHDLWWAHRLVVSAVNRGDQAVAVAETGHFVSPCPGPRLVNVFLGRGGSKKYEGVVASTKGRAWVAALLRKAIVDWDLAPDDLEMARKAITDAVAFLNRAYPKGRQ